LTGVSVTDENQADVTRKKAPVYPTAVAGLLVAYEKSQLFVRRHSAEAHARF